MPQRPKAIEFALVAEGRGPTSFHVVGHRLPRGIVKTTEEQGVNNRWDVRHHSLLALQESSFVVVDRFGGEGKNCDLLHMPESEPLIVG